MESTEPKESTEFLANPAVITNQKPWSELSQTLPLLRKPSGSRVIVVAPHPDDETLGLGGLIFDWNAAGIDVRVLIVSDGGKSHSHSRLVDLRREEALAAAELLGIRDRVAFLEYPDAKLTAHHKELVEAILVNIPTDAGHCVVLAPRLHDGHPDHDACARAAAQVAASVPTVEHWSYGVWTWTQVPRPDILVGAFRWPMSAEGYKAKWKAIGMYASQVTTMLGEQIVTDQLLESLATPTEVVWC